MDQLEVYIVCHNKQSFDYFNSINQNTPNKDKFKYILVGNHTDICVGMPKDRTIIATWLPDNIEKHGSLLTFTAWYALSRNNIIKSSHVCILEYDCKVIKDLYSMCLANDVLFGFLKRGIPDIMFLDCLVDTQDLLTEDEKNVKNKIDFWCPTTNFIMSVDFLNKFVLWFMKFIPNLFSYIYHSHFHERVITVFAINNNYKILCADNYLYHRQLYSHKDKF